MIYNDYILNKIVEDCFDTRIVKDGDTLIVALSGGMDSMCLMDSLIKLQSEINYKLMAIHIHHGIRGIEANRDREFAKSYCNSMNVKLVSKKVNAISYSKKNNLTLEEAARRLRYDEFNKLWEKEVLKNPEGNVYIAVAHHQNDQAETIIHNIIRGTGIKGIVGMKQLNGYILRPLLNVDKKEIEKFIKLYNVPYVEDSTNDDIYYTRNYIRKEIIKKFEKINSEAISHINELSKQANELNEYIEKTSKYQFKKTIEKEDSCYIALNLKKFNQNDNIIKSGIIKEVLNRLVYTLKDITKININDVIVLASKEKGGHLDLPYNLTVDKKQNRLIFTKNNGNISMSRRKKK